jgi:hypothetical protein
VPARGPIWEARWKKVEAFRRRLCFLRVTGSYAINCPNVEDRYPALEGQLRLDISIHPETEEDGILTGNLDLGLFKGIVALGTNDLSLDVWCRRNSHTGRTADYAKCPESQRLDRRYLFARRSLGMEKGSPLPRADIDFETLPAFPGEYRCRDDRELFSASGVVFSGSCGVRLKDTMGMQLKGEITFPMLSGEAIPFDAFKLRELPAVHTTARSWKDYDTESIRHSSTWKE